MLYCRKQFDELYLLIVKINIACINLLRQIVSRCNSDGRMFGCNKVLKPKKSAVRIRPTRFLKGL